MASPYKPSTFQHKDCFTIIAIFKPSELLSPPTTEPYFHPSSYNTIMYIVRLGENFMENNTHKLPPVLP